MVKFWSSVYTKIIAITAILMLVAWGAAEMGSIDLNDLPGYFKDVPALAGLVFIVVEFLKANVFKGVKDFAVIIMSLATGIVLALGGGYFTWLDGTFMDWVIFGGAAGLGASALSDGVGGIAKKLSPKQEEA